MKKIQKNKKGFTLIEMIIVIAIIVILASVLFFAIQKYLDKANDTATGLSSKNQQRDSIFNSVSGISIP